MGSNNNPSIFVGDIINTKNYGDVVVIDYVNCYNITVKFLNTGSIKVTNSAQLKNGVLKDKTVRIYGVAVGQEFITNNHGKCVVVQYDHAKKILVQFENCGTLKWTNSSQLQSGTASPKPKLSAEEIKDRNRARASIKRMPGKRSKPYTQEEAVKVMSEKNNNFYDYSLFNFVNVKTKSTVICPLHGAFEISFDNHVNCVKGQEPSGCRACGIEKRAAKKTLDSSLFLKEASEVGQVGYTYNLTTYKNRNTKMEILCNTCGNTFKQSPEKHLTGQGCSFCNKAGFDPTKKGVLYVLASNSFTKIGITNKHAEDRAKEINRTVPDKFDVVKEYQMSGVDCTYIEKKFLEMLRADYDSPAEKFDGYTECFIGLRGEDLVEMIDCIT